MKRIVLLGRGTVGAISAGHIIENISNSNDYEIQWIYDPEIQTQAVGEGVALPIMRFLRDTLDFTHDDMKLIDGNFKTGIMKEGWGETGNKFIHNFQIPNVAYHLNARKFQDYAFNRYKENKKIQIIEKNIRTEDIDADHIIDCSGKPTNFDENFQIVNDIPVNSVYVTQCFWDHPKFTYSLSNAAKHGWYFGIPLQNRCSIGYLYNNNITTLDEIKDEVKDIFKKHNLIPSDNTNAFSFKNYYRKNVFNERISYNGNSCFFLEPLEATTLTVADLIAQIIVKKLLRKTNKTYLQMNCDVQDYIEATADMISMHYYAGSIYNTEFWKYAKEISNQRISKSFIKNPNFREMLEKVLFSRVNYNKVSDPSSYGTWAPFSFQENILGLGIENKLKTLFTV